MSALAIGDVTYDAAPRRRAAQSRRSTARDDEAESCLMTNAIIIHEMPRLADRRKCF